jgi:hypothetical protein
MVLGSIYHTEYFRYSISKVETREKNATKRWDFTAVLVREAPCSPQCLHRKVLEPSNWYLRHI